MTSVTVFSGDDESLRCSSPLPLKLKARKTAVTDDSINVNSGLVVVIFVLAACLLYTTTRVGHVPSEPAASHMSIMSEAQPCPFAAAAKNVAAQRRLLQVQQQAQTAVTAGSTVTGAPFTGSTTGGGGGGWNGVGTPPTPPIQLPTPADNLNLLSALVGRWVGTGHNQISLPVALNPNGLPFRLLLSDTIEQLEFIPISAKPIADRGGPATLSSTIAQPDTFLSGLHYLQEVADGVSHAGMHLEPGLILSMPPTTVNPVQPATTIARLGSIPHGHTILMQGVAFQIPGPPTIVSTSSLPFVFGSAPFSGVSPTYDAPFTNAAGTGVNLPTGFTQTYVTNPNQALVDVISTQTINSTVVFEFTTTPFSLTTPSTPDPYNQTPNLNGSNILIPQAGGILNIPFLEAQADVTTVNATFWVETVINADGTSFLQLQYTQTVVLDFLGIHWPHVTTATLVQQ